MCGTQYDGNPPFSCVNWLYNTPLSIISLSISNTLGAVAALSFVVAFLMKRCYGKYNPTENEMEIFKVNKELGELVMDVIRPCNPCNKGAADVQALTTVEPKNIVVNPDDDYVDWPSVIELNMVRDPNIRQSIVNMKEQMNEQIKALKQQLVENNLYGPPLNKDEDNSNLDSISNSGDLAMPIESIYPKNDIAPKTADDAIMKTETKRSWW